MPILVTPIEAFQEHLETLGVQSGARLLVHSRLISFGLVDGGSRAVLKSLTDMAGPQGTIVVPTYTFDITADDIYDPAETSAHGMGDLSKLVLGCEGRVRSSTPIHNHAGIGRDAGLLASSDMTTSMGCNSDFDVLMRNGFTHLMLGCRFSEGASFLHFVEAVCGVPYRKEIKLRRRIRLNGSVKDISVNYFGRKEPAVGDIEYEENFDLLEDMLVATGNLQRVPVAYGYSTAIPMPRLFSLARAEVLKNPYCLVQPVAALEADSGSN